MRRSPLRILPAACLLLATEGGPAPAAGGDTAGTVSCALSAWSTDREREGLAVHAGPGTGTPVVARLPPPVEAGGHTFAAEVSITGSRHGWFRIDGARLDNPVADEAPGIVLAAEGWVPGRSLGLLLNRMDLRRGPSAGAPVVARLLGEGPGGEAHGPDSFLVDRLHACRGEWVEVEGTFLGASLRGWATGTCSNQVTTCP